MRMRIDKARRDNQPDGVKRFLRRFAAQIANRRNPAAADISIFPF